MPASCNKQLPKVKSAWRLLEIAEEFTFTLVSLEQSIVQQCSPLLMGGDDTRSTDERDAELDLESGLQGILNRVRKIATDWAHIPKEKWLVFGTPKPMSEQIELLIKDLQQHHGSIAEGRIKEDFEHQLSRARESSEKLLEYSETDSGARDWGSVQGQGVNLKVGEPLLTFNMNPVVDGSRISISEYQPSVNSEGVKDDSTLMFPPSLRKQARRMFDYALTASLATATSEQDAPVTPGGMEENQMKSMDGSWDKERVNELYEAAEQSLPILKRAISSIREPSLIHQSFPGGAEEMVTHDGWTAAVPLHQVATLDHPSKCTLYFMFHTEGDGWSGRRSVSDNSRVEPAVEAAGIASLISRALGGRANSDHWYSALSTDMSHVSVQLRAGFVRRTPAERSS